MRRRNFLQHGLMAGSAALVSGSAIAASSTVREEYADKPFNLNYAIHDGMFKNSAGNDFIDQIKFAYYA